MIISHIYVLVLLAITSLYLNGMWLNDRELEGNLDFTFQATFLGLGTLVLTTLNVLGKLSNTQLFIFAPVILLISLNSVTDLKGHFIFDKTNIIMYILIVVLIAYNFYVTPMYWIMLPLPVIILIVSFVANKLGVMASGDIPILALLSVMFSVDGYIVFLFITGVCALCLTIFLFAKSKVTKLSMSHESAVEVSTIDDENGYVAKGKFIFPFYPLIWVSTLISIILVGVM